jgi:CHAT domain-containing protein
LQIVQGETHSSSPFVLCGKYTPQVKNPEFSCKRKLTAGRRRQNLIRDPRSRNNPGDRAALWEGSSLHWYLPAPPPTGAQPFEHSQFWAAFILIGNPN